MIEELVVNGVVEVDLVESSGSGHRLRERAGEMKPEDYRWWQRGVVEIVTR